MDQAASQPPLADFVLISQLIASRPNTEIVMSLDNNSSAERPSPFKRLVLREYSDVPLSGATLYDLVVQFGSDGQLDHTTANGNRIVCTDTRHIPSMKRIRVGFSGKDNNIYLDKLSGISRLDIACIGASAVRFGRSDIVRGATLMASHGAKITVGAACMLSRDIILYASGAHGVYNSSNGERRGSTTIHIDDRVWLGQGARILAGAQVGTGSVIGSYSVLAGKVPNNCAAAGNPCRVTSRDIFWTKESVTGNYFVHRQQSGNLVPEFANMTEIN